MRALDLFAGTGWGVACQRLGIEEMGVEIMPEATATREANGMRTIYHDVWDGLDAPKLAYELLIASPPCQTFSMAGSGSGRKALDEVIKAIAVGAYRNPAKLREFGENHDPRTALVLTPLAHVYRDMPMFVALEQVPTVLPVWEACAVVMRGWGYSVKVANLHAEQYGVPQTRKRAILVARRDGLEVQLPTPTHSKYYSNKPAKLDPGVLPWVSMAEALGWVGEKWPQQDQPATTVAGDPRVALRKHHSRESPQMQGAYVTTVDEAAALQSFPPIVFRNGNQANAARRPVTAPAPTVHFGQRSNKVEWLGAADADDVSASGRRVTVEEASALQSYPTWPYERPAPTIVGTRRPEGGMLIGRQLDDGSRRDVGGRQTATGLRPGMLPGVRVSGDEAATLQSYARPFQWRGSKSKQFLQIGNAVPPLLAQHVLTALTQVAEAGLETPA